MIPASERMKLENMNGNKCNYKEEHKLYISILITCSELVNTEIQKVVEFCLD